MTEAGNQSTFGQEVVEKCEFGVRERKQEKKPPGSLRLSKSGVGGEMGGGERELEKGKR